MERLRLEAQEPESLAAAGMWGRSGNNSLHAFDGKNVCLRTGFLRAQTSVPGSTRGDINGSVWVFHRLQRQNSLASCSQQVTNANSSASASSVNLTQVEIKFPLATQSLHC